jgi:ferredoxin--NADP+ reductase
MPMMRAVAETTGRWHLPALVSLDPLMIDGTGMCGGCRVSVGGVTKFACVDGPFFPAEAVDFDEVTDRKGMYAEDEKVSCELAEAEVTA